MVAICPFCFCKLALLDACVMGSGPREQKNRSDLAAATVFDENAKTTNRNIRRDCYDIPRRKSALTTGRDVWGGAGRASHWEPEREEQALAFRHAPHSTLLLHA